ncbi:TPA: O-antigen ligase family protein [Pasteurella multocida]|uniref:O-antigen ligase family protein n=1 Tax=Pasteurella multocida TaxID=747 RepID=UPI00145BA3E8|nr:O-antigen ligase [Pasteurella multocida]NMK16176.1 O-antigen ligase family protein [Pasteurella multocida]URH75398.1 O-antigen ligase family protein [Pasteurella multocida]URH89328.1 O-antigen ligase family protein [Pasteurella multocida]HDR1027478.1 O-antigen ligase family protein [Pasteurella multocida]HDR1065717.1 O-antigen ligase family protein [Pasteurella multocida]
MQSLKKSSLYVLSINFIIFIFFPTLFLVKGGHNIASVGLCGIALIYLISRLLNREELDSLPRAEKIWMLCLLFYSATFLLSFFWHAEKLRELEHIAKLCLFIPLLYLFERYRPHINWLLKGILFGAIIAGGVAIYDRFILNVYAAYSPRMLQIQAGDIAMSLGLFSFVIGLHSFSRQQYRQMLWAIIAMLFGILGSVLSTARGGWIGLPLLLCFALFAYRQYLSKKILFFVSLFFVFLLAAVAFAPKTKLISRVTEAYTETQQYFDAQAEQSTSIGARFALWKSALLMAKEKPLLGWGNAGAMEKRQVQQQEGVISEYAANFTHAHNQYLDNLSKYGLVGLVALLAIFSVPFCYFYRKRHAIKSEEKLVATLGMLHIISVMCYSLTQAFLNHNSGNIFYFLSVFIFYGCLKHSEKE